MIEEAPACVFQVPYLIIIGVALIIFWKKRVDLHFWFGGVGLKEGRTILLAIIFLGILLRISFWPFFTPTDEGIYIYQAGQLYSGNRPYIDFALVHPPLYHYLTSIIFQIFGVGLLQAKILPLVLSILSLPLFYKTAKLFLDDLEAMLSTLVYSLSYGIVLMTSTAIL
ncbi:glycosyltransferase family 39 protein, partial [Candidatus Altiarchaeota archaeon]